MSPFPKIKKKLHFNISDNELKGKLTIPENSKIKELEAKRNDISVSLVSKMYENDTHQYNINVQENSFKIGKYFITGSNYVLGSEDEITIKINDCINFIEVIIAQNEKPDFKSAVKCLAMFLCFVIISPIIILAIIYIIFTLTFTRNS